MQYSYLICNSLFFFLHKLPSTYETVNKVLFGFEKNVFWQTGPLIGKAQSLQFVQFTCV